MVGEGRSLSDRQGDKSLDVSLDFMDKFNLKLEMYDYLSHGCKQHTTAEAHPSKFVIKVRWVVE